MSRLQKTLENIKELTVDSDHSIQNRLDILTKPQGSLGKLEDLAIWYISARGCSYTTPENCPKFKDKVVFTMAGDHGVAAKGVSAFPSEVTPQMVLNFLGGGAGINVLSKHVGARVNVVDCGVAFDFAETPGLIQKKIAKGTADMSEGPAMSREQAAAAIEIGISCVEEEIKNGLDIIGTGDMGIANTTPSTAILAAYSGLPVEEITGRGTGVDDEGLKIKHKIVKQALEINKPDTSDAIDVLSKVGGFEIGAIAGLCLAGARHNIPVVVDGFISTAGALIAVKLKPEVKNYLLCAHKSVEAGHIAMMKEIGCEPLLDLGFRLGEGTGAALAIGMVDAGLKIINEMATFGEAGVSDKED
ncbi:MAG: nicotinate-nucleotide--dimethylbenzimidazole phosphoribosyltransferase [Planctomycetota bacterium]|jgi:nicotinate-nucleotide--dimethylbenzimidazole phosphoribosyltransferase